MPSCHTPTREEALLVSTVHKDERYSKAAAVTALRVITASQQHGFPLTALRGRLELNCLPPVSSLLSQSELFSSSFCFSRVLNCHPLKSRVSASSPAPHTKPAHGPIAEAIKLSTSLSLLLLPLPPLKSSPLLTPSPPKFFLAASPQLPLPSLVSLLSSWGAWLVVSHAAGKRSQMLT